MGGDGITFLRAPTGMEWKFCGDGWVCKGNWTGTSGDGNEICGDGCNFCPHAGLYCHRRHNKIFIKLFILTSIPNFSSYLDSKQLCPKLTKCNECRTKMQT